MDTWCHCIRDRSGLPPPDYEGQHYRCPDCGRRWVTYCIDFSAGTLRYRWAHLPTDCGTHSGVPGLPIVGDGKEE